MLLLLLLVVISAHSYIPLLGIRLVLETHILIAHCLAYVMPLSLTDGGHVVDWRLLILLLFSVDIVVARVVDTTIRFIVDVDVQYVDVVDITIEIDVVVVEIRSR